MSITRRHLVKSSLLAAGAPLRLPMQISYPDIVKLDKLDKEAEYGSPRHYGTPSLSPNITDLDQLVGYAAPLSVSPGETLKLHISTAAPKVDYWFVRFKKTPFGGCCLRMTPREKWDGRIQPYQEYVSATKGCDWKPNRPFTIPDQWKSGIYGAYCRDSWKRDFFISFVVRPPRLRKQRPSILVVANTNTWNAYNDFGQWSRYNYSGGQPNDEFSLSFERPNCHAQPFWPGMKNAGTQTGPLHLGTSLDFKKWEPSGADRFGLREDFVELPDFNMRHTLGSELWFLNWLEDTGRQFDVCSDFDLHTYDAVDLGKYELLILTSHPEYWSQGAYENVAAFLKKEKRCVLNLGGNGLYERVGYDTNRGMVIKGWPTNQNRTNLFKSERTVLGLSEDGSRGSNTGYLYRTTAKGAQNKFFKDAGLAGKGTDGTLCQFGSLGLNGRACGWEMDRASDSEDVLASGEYWPQGAGAGSAGDIYCKIADGGGFVFGAASINFTGSLVVDHRLDKLINSVIEHALSGANSTS